MRDLLTALAGAVILLLVAALAVPPLIDWTAYRGVVDQAVSRSLGLPVRSEGRLEVRLLPSPRLRIDRLHLGEGAESPNLDARFVKAEVALFPLLSGEFRFTETRIGRAELRLPVTGNEALLVPADLPAAFAGRDFAIEDLQIQQFLLTTRVPATGRTDQLYAQDLRLQAPALAGPWRVDGTSGGVPFRLTSGALAEDGVAVKLSGGGEEHPRFEAEARLSLEPGRGARQGRAVQAEGSARLVVGPPSQVAGAYLPLALSGRFKATGSQVRFETVTAEIDPGGRPLRLAGSGDLNLRQWRAALALQARRLDLDGFLASPEGQALLARGLPKAGSALPVLLDLDLAVESLALGAAEWSDLAFAATLDRGGGLVLKSLRATAPGGAVLGASGAVETAPTLHFNGPVSLSAPRSEGFGRYLRRIGLTGPAVAVLDGRPVEASADVAAALPSLDLRNLRLALGPARITGNARYTAPQGAARGRFEAQIAARGIDVAALPPLNTAFAALDGHDLGLTLEARDVRYGATDTGIIAARIQSDGPSLVVDSLEVTNLAGANAALSGRISPDGAGRIAGRLSAPAAAPLLALLDRVWTGESRFVPDFLRAGALDLALTLERDSGAAEALRATAQGRAGGGDLDLTLTSRAGRLERAAVRLAHARAAAWFGRADLPGLQGPAALTLQVERAGEGGLDLQVGGTIAGLRLTTGRPLRIAPEDDLPIAGEIRAETADLAPYMALAGLANLTAGAWPAAVTVGFGREGGDLRADLAGQVAGANLGGRLRIGLDGSVGGALSLARLSLPQVAAALVPADAARSRPAPLKPRGPVLLDLTVGALELGRGLTAAGAGFRLGLDDGALSLRDLDAKLAEGRLAGSAVVARRGGTLSVSGEGTLADAALAALADGSPLSGRLSAKLRFGASGPDAAALAANLAGSGTLTLTDLTVPEADPAALGRALARALEIDDPLREGRLPQIVGAELGRAAAQARGSVSAPATIVGGVLRAGPLDLDLGAARWTGSLAYDLARGRLEARGLLAGGAVPQGWTAGAPAVQLGLSGSLGAPERSLDTGALATGLAAVVLQRELERIELIEADQMERQRRRARIEMDRARAAAIKAAEEEAQRQARIKAQQAAAEEAARQVRAREAEEAARRVRSPEHAPQEAEPAGAQP
ncbi:AsmA family protein [Methylobacterium symbioticum]